MPRVPSGDPDAADQQPSVQVNVVDTPGLFDPGLSNAETVAEIGRALSLVPGGVIHAALFVLNGDDVRFTSLLVASRDGGGCTTGCIGALAASKLSEK